MGRGNRLSDLFRQGWLDERGIGDFGSADFGEGGEFVGTRQARAGYMFDGDITDKKGIGDEGAMAAPRDGFGAHEGGAGGLGEFDDGFEAGGEFGGLHVIGEAPEGRIAPAGVHGIASGVAQSAEAGEVDILQPCLLEGTAEGVLVKLWIMARAGDGAHIGNAVNPVDAEQINEFSNGAG